MYMRQLHLLKKGSTKLFVLTAVVSLSATLSVGQSLAKEAKTKENPLHSAKVEAKAPKNVAVNCEVCAKRTKKILELEDAKEKNTKLLGDNNAYLAMLSSKEASKFLKIESNKKMILDRIDTIKRELELNRQNFEQEGCNSCQTETKANQ